MSTYYISTTGSNTNSGAIDAPWATIAYGVSHITAGDTLYIREGSYHENVSITVSGTSSSRILISGYQDEDVTIDGEYTLPGGSVYNFLTNITGSYVTLQNLNIRHSTGGLLYVTGGYSYGVNVSGSGSYEGGFVLNGNSEKFDGCDVTQIGWHYGIDGQTSWGAGLSIQGWNCLIQNCTAQNCQGEGISIINNGTSSSIVDSISYDNKTCGIYIDSSDNVTVARNLLYRTTPNGDVGHTGILVGNEQSNTMTNINILNNLVAAHRTNLTLENDGLDTLTNVFIANNTFVNGNSETPGYTMGVYIKTTTLTGSRFVNNICLEEDSGRTPITVLASSSGITFDHNCFNKATDTDAYGAGDVISDPLIAKIGNVSNSTYYMLQGNSPCINAGSAVAKVTVDYDGVTREDPPEMGAFQYTTSELSIQNATHTLTSNNITLSVPTVNLINIDLEENDFSDFTTTVTDSGNLSVSASAAMAGTNYGLSCLINDTTSIYGRKDIGSSNTSGIVRYRVYLDPNSISMPAWSNFITTRLFDGSGTPISLLYVLYNGTYYQVKAAAYNDAASVNQTSYYNILDNENYIEVLMSKSTGANDGVLTLWVNDDQKESITTIDNDTAFNSFRYMRMGAEYISSSSINGTFYMDEFVLNDTGAEIGAKTLEYQLVVNDAQHSTVSDSPTLTYHVPGPVTLSIQNATNEISSNTVTLVYHEVYTPVDTSRTVTLSTNADTNIYMFYPTTNYGTGEYIRVGESDEATGATFRSLIKFDLSSLRGLTVISATLRLRAVTGEQSSNARIQSVYILRRDWTETQATWNIAKTGTDWGTEGATNTSTDRYETAIGATSIPANPVVGTWYEWDLNVGEVQKMIDGIYPSYGFIVQAATESNDQTRYSSREGADPPELVITYTTGGLYWIIE